MSHVTDDLELFALGALAPAEAARVSGHLAACATCRMESAELANVVGALPDAVTPREVPPALRDRILASARAEIRRAGTPQPVLTRILRFRPSRFALAGLVAAVLILVAVDLRELGELKTADAEHARVESMVKQLGQSGRSWYMPGGDQWKGSGATFAVSQADGKAVVLFHDLKPVPAGQVYALWLVSPDGRWVRGANVRPDGRRLQLVDVVAQVEGFDRCVVTLEDKPDGRREGPVVMQSRIAPAP